MKRFAPYFGLLIVALFAALAIAALTTPPAPVASAPPTDFSAERAMAHVRRIASEPHPMGSPGSDDVRTYIVSTFEALGLETRVVEGRAAVRVAGSVSSGRVKNVVARLPGTRPGGKAVALAAHYDAVPSSMGASDDGSGIATLLETARALAAAGSSARPNDVLFLATDGEEVATLGAQALAADPAFVGRLGVVLNFEARGSHGAVAMYDPADASGELVRVLGESVSRPVASSFLAALAKALPNDSDVTAFKRANVPALGFAYADGFENYHRRTDDVAHLDPASLQHDGMYAVALADALGHRDLAAIAAPDIAYFDVFARVLVRYPLWAARVFALLTLVAFGAVVRRARGKALVSLRGMAAGAGVFLLAIVLAAAVGVGTQAVFGRSLDYYRLLALVKLTSAATLLVAAAVQIAVYGLALRWIAPANLTFGVLGTWCLALAAAAVFAPAVTPPLEWPLAFALAGSAAAMFRQRSAAVVIGLVPGAVLVAGVVFSVIVATGATMLAAPAVFAAFGFGLLVPLIAERRTQLVVAPLALAGGLVLGFVATRENPYRNGEPWADSLVYAIDTDANDARFFSYDRWISPWTKRAMPGGSYRQIPAFSRWRDGYYFSGDAALEPHPASELSILEDVTSGAVRHVRVRITTAKDTRCVTAWDTEHTILRATAIDGAPVRDLFRFSPERDEELLRMMTGDTSPHAFHMHHCELAEGALELDLDANAGAPIKLRVVAESLGLPTSVPARDGHTIPSESSDMTLVSRLATF